MKTTTIGIDLAKSVFQLHCVDVHGNHGILRGEYRLPEPVAWSELLQPSQRKFALFAVLKHANLPRAGGVRRHFPKAYMQPTV